MAVMLNVFRPARRPKNPRALSGASRVRRGTCKLCKRLIDLADGVFFENGQTGRLGDFQCRVCTAWELAPERIPGNVRTDLLHDV